MSEARRSLPVVRDGRWRLGVLDDAWCGRQLADAQQVLSALLPGLLHLLLLSAKSAAQHQLLPFQRNPGENDQFDEHDGDEKSDQVHGRLPRLDVGCEHLRAQLRRGATPIVASAFSRDEKRRGKRAKHFP